MAKRFERKRFERLCVGGKLRAILALKAKLPDPIGTPSPLPPTARMRVCAEKSPKHRGMCGVSKTACLVFKPETLAETFGRLRLKVAVEAEIGRQRDVATRVWRG